MGVNHKIAIKNVCIVNICFRQKGKLSNRGKVILEIDTYDFAGHLSDDVIIAFYRDGKYYIHYYYNHYIFDDDSATDLILDSSYDYEQYELEMRFDFKKNKLPEDFCSSLEEGEYSITFEGIEKNNLEAINYYLHINSDLLEPRI